MTGEPIDIAGLLGLPARARDAHRLTKKDIVAQWDHSSPSDARLLNRAISSAQIVGVLSPTTIGAPASREPDRPVDMIPVVEVALTAGVTPADRTRVAELLHRAMPRPAVLGLDPDGTGVMLSLALTRLSRSDEGKSVIEEHLLVPVDGIAPESLHVSSLDRTDLAAMYRDLVRTAAADGKPASGSLTASEAVALRRRAASLEEDIAAVTRVASREKAIQRQIELNTKARELREELEQARFRLYGAFRTETRSADDPKVGQ